MNRRPFLKLVSALTIASAFAASAASADTIRIGAVAPKTGPLAGGATVTQWPSIYLWVDQINKAGGLTVDGAKNDDRTDRI